MSSKRHVLDLLSRDELLDLRASLGLPRAPRHPFHLTLGRIKARR